MAQESSKHKSLQRLGKENLGRRRTPNQPESPDKVDRRGGNERRQVTGHYRTGSESNAGPGKGRGRARRKSQPGGAR